MQYRRLGRTGIRVSALSFGTGPVSTLMVGNDAERQRQVIAHAIERGINWLDTAATYGNGQSEDNIGRALQQLAAAGRVHVATKVRLQGDDVRDIPAAIRRSIAASLSRLRLPNVTLLQLHNSITANRDDEPTSITPADVLGPRGVLETFQQLQAEGLVKHIGLTGIGQPVALREVVNSGQFDTLQVPYHLLNPSAGWDLAHRPRPASRPDAHERRGEAVTDYGNIIADCARHDMGVCAIRVLAGGAVVGNPPSPHTLKTPFFPLALYEHDAARAARLKEIFGPQCAAAELAIQFALSHPFIHSALIGFGDEAEIDSALHALDGLPSRINWDDVLMALER